jgi:NAD-dependent deacetylase
MSIARAIETLRDCTNILVFTGAGISTESGIPDFRGPDGVWTKVDPEEFTIQRYLANSATRRRSWAMRSEAGMLRAEPNDGHHAITDLWEAERLVGLVTQNIDGLHVASGFPEDAIAEVHGNVRTTSCTECGDRLPTGDVLERLDAGEEDPACIRCGGILKVDVVMFGEAMPEQEMTRAMAMAMVADAALSVGSTLSVYPAAYVPLTVVESGRPLVIVNRGETELDQVATVTVEEGATEALRAMADALI